MLTRAGVALFSDDHHYSPEKAERDFGWRARVTVEEGLRQTRTWMEECEAAKVAPRPVELARSARGSRLSSAIE
jgi:dTDP-D-glucose 4,6-dehydratase